MYIPSDIISTIVPSTSAPTENSREPTASSVVTTPTWDISTSSISGTHHIHNTHLPLIYTTIPPCATLPSSEHITPYVVPSSNHVPFLQAGLQVGNCQLVSLLPSILNTKARSGMEAMEENEQTIPWKSSPRSKTSDYFCSDEGFISTKTHNHLTESQRFSIISNSDGSHLYDSPSQVHVDDRAAPTPGSVLSATVSPIQPLGNHLLHHPQQLRKFSEPPLPSPQRKLSQSMKKSEESPPMGANDDSCLRNVTFNHLNQVVEIPSKLTHTVLTAQLEEASFEASDKDIVTEEVESTAAA